MKPEVQRMKLFKATVTVNGRIEEAPMWARNIDEALEAAEQEYGEVSRIRPTVAPDVRRFEVTQ